MDRVAQGGTWTGTAIYQTGAGDLVDPTGQAIDIIDPDGVELVTNAVPTRTSLGNFTYAYVVPALGPVGVWRAHWSGTVDGFDAGGEDWFNVVTPAELITDGYVTVAELRALPNLGDPVKFTDAELTAALGWFETTFEDFTAVAWIPRTVIGEQHKHTATGHLLLDHLFIRDVAAVRYYTDAGAVAYTAGELADLHHTPSGVLARTSLGSFTSPYGLIEVDYTHGWDAPPADVVEACKTAVRAHLLDDHQANRQYAVSTEAGIVRTSQPGKDRPFGIPEVDAVAVRRCHRSPSLG